MEAVGPLVTALVHLWWASATVECGVQGQNAVVLAGAELFPEDGPVLYAGEDDGPVDGVRQVASRGSGATSARHQAQEVRGHVGRLPHVYGPRVDLVAFDHAHSGDLHRLDLTASSESRRGCAESARLRPHSW
eukprot:CAMPEP_0171260950 /NCGR_PEP_ID=MMETSP0790-20130122/55727_1 /TAXON_ID=2925 /ORGANISM="Alexandrium catenella, Strain OF101" /LENGTH=132 /DNA_ID=CAMNT_0011729311 /DNA_START=91 /DNA_END=489 /DNA_ORIENTATION=+